MIRGGEGDGLTKINVSASIFIISIIGLTPSRHVYLILDSMPRNSRNLSNVVSIYNATVEKKSLKIIINNLNLHRIYINSARV